MRGIWLDGRTVALRRDLPEPESADGYTVLKVLRVGICDTDLQLAKGYMGFRGVPGHEFVGETENGRRVTAEINNACHACPTCAAGMPGHCPNRTVLGILGHPGAMAERVSVPLRNIHEIPDAIDDRMAVFIEPLAAALQIVFQVPDLARKRCCVLGDGKLGILCAWVLQAPGAEVTLVGKHAEKLALAGDGIHTTLLDDVDAIERAFDLVVDATGSTTGLPTAMRLVRPRGTIVMKTTVAARFEVDLAPLVIAEIQLIGSRCGPFPAAIEALADGRFDVLRLIGAEFPLDEAQAAFQAAGVSGARKVVLRVG